MPSNSDTIFHQTRELRSDEERRRYLDEACAGDAALRGEVEALLAQAALADAFFDEPETVAGLSGKPRADMAFARPAGEQAGEMIGRYKLLHQIGEGGFGTVWMAEQTEPVTRRVALKIIKPGMDSGEVIARFEQERQVLALMDHPHIAQVFDAGATDRGRPYFVMELVKGIPITTFCDEKQFDTRARLALFEDVCSAINHAHQKGIIHRDIKPSNVMVTLHGDKAVVKVIDFGVAKATQGKLTDKSLFTRFEQFIGTPVYMSPEQAALGGLDIDTRSDIYALGILLYELLTGKPPFDEKTLASAGYDEMRRIIREVEPPRPSSRLSTVLGEERTALARARHTEPDKLSRLMEPDLDWIVMKAIEKDRTRRYETANAFATDIRRFLADDPVSATPPGAGYLLRKFARRHRRALRVAAVIALLLVAGTVTSVLLAFRAMRAEKELERQAKQNSNFMRLVTSMLQSPDAGRGDSSVNAELLQKIGQFIEDLHGPGHLDTLQTKALLASSYDTPELRPGVITLREQLLPRFAAHAERGPWHPATKAVRDALVGDYLAIRDRMKAVQLREKTVDLARQTLPAIDLRRLTAEQDLNLTLSAVDRHGEAIPFQKKVLAAALSLTPSQDEFVRSAQEALNLCTRAAGRPDDEASGVGLPVMPPALRPVRGTPLIAAEDTWTWLHPLDGTDPADKFPGFHQQFFLPEFADTGWREARAAPGPDGGFGYSIRGDLNLGVPPPGQRHSAYFRRHFQTTGTHPYVELRCQHDDGIIVYLDGVEAGRSNMPAAPAAESYRLAATDPYTEGHYAVLRVIPLPALMPGEHTLAISLHNYLPDSTDLRLGNLTVVEVEKK